MQRNTVNLDITIFFKKQHDVPEGDLPGFEFVRSESRLPVIRAMFQSPEIRSLDQEFAGLAHRDAELRTIRPGNCKLQVATDNLPEVDDQQGIRSRKPFDACGNSVTVEHGAGRVDGAALWHSSNRYRDNMPGSWRKHLIAWLMNTALSCSLFRLFGIDRRNRNAEHREDE